MLIILLAVFGTVAAVFLYAAFSWYRIVDPSEAHLVVTPKGKFVVSPDENVATEGKKIYFDIPNWIPFFGRATRIMDVTIKEFKDRQETIEKKQARYDVTSSLKYRIIDVQTAAETFVSNEELQDQLKEVVRSSVRAVTVKYDLVDARALKQTMSKEIETEMKDDLDKWGLELINFQLVDFQDTKDSTVVSDISKRREVEIQSTTREQNAEKLKQARIKEAEAEEKAKQREIEKDRTIGEQNELMKQKISEKEKLAKEKEYEVKKVEVVRLAEITKMQAEVKAKQDKEVALIKANQDKEAEKIMMEQKRLEGEGDRKRAQEQAKGQAAPIKETGLAEAEIIKVKGLAEAEAKEKIQAALNKFGDNAIRALIAEKVVQMQETVGIETAQALKAADVKVFAGSGKNGEQGFELGKMIESMSVSNDSTAQAVLNKLARPNDLGLSALGLKQLKDGAKNE